MNILIAALTLLLITLIGFLIIKFFNLLPAKKMPFLIGASYGLGVGLVSFQLYLYSRIGIDWSREYIGIFWLIFFTPILIKLRRKFKIKRSFRGGLDSVSLVLLVGIILMLSYALFEALIRPISAYDAWAIWLNKSKFFFMDGFINNQIQDYAKSDYPLVFSLLGTFVYLFLGKVDDSAVLLISWAYLFALVLVFYSAISDRFGGKYALFFSFLLVTIQNFVRHGGRFEGGQADLPLGFYIFISTVLLLDYIKNKKERKIFILSMFLGICGLVKFDGMPFIIISIVTLIIVIIRAKRFKDLIFLLIPILLISEWQVYKTINHVGVSYFTSHPIEMSLVKTKNTFFGVFKEFINIKSWNLLWIVYFYLVKFVKPNNLELFLINIFILVQIFIYVILYIFTSGNTVESSFSRLLMHVAPLALFSVAISLKDKRRFFYA